MPKFKTRDEDRGLFSNFLKKAEEYFHTAEFAFKEREYNASCGNAIHSIISGSDALCVYFLGKRSVGESHGDALGLLNTLPLKRQEVDVNTRRMSRILGVKNLAEYESRLILREEAESALKSAGRFLYFVRQNLPRIS